MARDSLYGESIIWQGHPKVTRVPVVCRVGGIVMGSASAIATSAAILVASSVRAPVGGFLIFAAWCATLAVLLGWGPAIWRSEARYIVTASHVMWQRGRIRRTIERSAITYARIHWYPGVPGVGDLELIRAVPTGALRRRLSLVLHGIAGPDRVWAAIRGTEASGAAGDGRRPLTQRLDDGERVLWAARPAGGWLSLLPRQRDGWTAILGIAVGGALVRELRVAIPAAHHVLASGLAPRSIPFVALVVTVSLTALLLAAIAIGLVYVALIRPAQQLRNTRYLITGSRVLIQRGTDELYLERSRIVDVIETKTLGGAYNIFLVLDGPRARALAAGGAFGERESSDRGLIPVLELVKTAESHSVSRILQCPCPSAVLNDAA